MAAIEALTATREAWPLYDKAANRILESEALGALPPFTLMQRAGMAVARLALALAATDRRVLCLTGGGNNGGDGWAAARVLRRLGADVQVWEVQPSTTEDARHARALALADGVPVVEGPPIPPAAPVLIIDALLGVGARSPLSAAVAQAIRWINTVREGSAHPVQVMAIDLPSGLDADTGTPTSDGDERRMAVHADHTLSFITLKPGLFTHEGRVQAGRIWFDSLGVTPAPDGPSARVPACAALASSKLLDLLRQPRIQADGMPRLGGHKGTFGDAWVVGGAPGMGGAARLAARACLHAGAGRVYRVALGTRSTMGEDESADTAQPEVMTRHLDALDAWEPGPTATFVVGCGGGQAVASVLAPVMHRAARLVLDADALNAVASDPDLQRRLTLRAMRGQHSVLTPHPLEAARLLGCSTSQVQANRVASAQALAEAMACTVVLKGSGSIVATVGRRPWINGTGNVRLASAGTGDVLAGWICGAWACQGMQADIHDVAAACVHLHGLAAERAVRSQGTGAGASAVLLAGHLIGEMALELVSAHAGHQR